MIIAFVGTPGSGKSYEAVKKILDNIKLGRKVYTNIEGLERPECRRAIADYCNVTDYQLETCLNHLTEQEAQQFWLHCEKQSLIIIDEIHRLFSNRNWQAQDNVAFTTWASTHRHEGYDCVFITQDIEKLDKHARSLIEWTYLFRKINQFGGKVQKRYMCYSYQYDNHKGKPLGTNIRTYEKKVFPCYQSYTAQDVKEVGFMKHYNVLKQPVFFIIPVIICVSLYFFLNSSFSKGQLIAVPDVANKADIKQKEVPPVVEVKKDENLEKKIAVKEKVNPEKQVKDVIKKYILPDGSFIYTNNDFVPEGAVYLSTI